MHLTSFVRRSQGTQFAARLVEITTRDWARARFALRALSPKINHSMVEPVVACLRKPFPMSELASVLGATEQALPNEVAE